ncbi:leucine-rich repeat domain-containing protein [Capnocytophaga canimorsus]|uniref:leucine-rich repeat domain-containing protein n=1 Tax=Capnocytophaga canimorsus TaxID=28188 RepID=UPI0015628A9C|nr:leucine-rich repeat domain-containing protein [Capnocytophaga canimorsus]
MRKIKVFLGLMLMASVMFVSCGKDDNKVEPPVIHEMKVENDVLTILEEESKTIKIVSGNGDYQVKSDNDNVAVTEKEGVITIIGQKAGRSTISVTDSKGKKASISITINTLVLDKAEVIIQKGEKAMVVIQSGSGIYSVVSDNEPVATAELSGTNITITAIVDGTATITVTDTKTNKTQQVNVIVTLIPQSYYNLSNDKTTLVKWLDQELTTLDMQSDPVLSKVTSIGVRAFLGSKLTSITLPNELKIIKERAFENSPLTSLVIPEGVTFIEGSAFYSCKTLATITLPQTLTEIGESAFKSCHKLNNVVIPDGVKQLKSDAFSDCRELATITLSNQLTHIGDTAFNGCGKLASIELPETLEEMGISAFSDCKALTSITIPNKVTELSNSLFWGCSNLASITIGEEVTTIGEEVFRDCAKLTSITIPSKVTDIGKIIFSGCNSLVSITMNPVTPPTLGFEEDENENFKYLYNNDLTVLKHIYVPSASLSEYQQAEGWSDYSDKISAQ